MNKKNPDFKLDLVKVAKHGGAPKDEVMITSKFLCTPGCITGWLHGCNFKTATCGCHIGVL